MAVTRCILTGSSRDKKVNEWSGWTNTQFKQYAVGNTFLLLFSNLPQPLLHATRVPDSGNATPLGPTDPPRALLRANHVLAIHGCDRWRAGTPAARISPLAAQGKRRNIILFRELPW